MEANNNLTLPKQSVVHATANTSTQEGDILQIDIANFARDNWSPRERANAELVIDFVQHLMNNHDFAYIERQFGANPYTQHNRGMKDGIAGVLEFVSTFAKQFPAFTYDVKHIYVDGDFVIFHSHATIQKKHRGNPDKGLNIIDTWRIEDGKIVEHWDAIQAVDGFMRFYAWMTGGKKQNENTLY